MITVDILKEDGNTVRAEAALNDPSNWNQTQRDSTVTLTLFEAQEKFIVDSDQTIPSGVTKQATDTIIKNNATLTVDGTLETGTLDIQDGTLDNNGTVTITGFEGGMDLLSFQPRAGGFTTIVSLATTVAFKEQLPSSGDVTSLLVGVEPAQELQDNFINGVWGLVERVEDNRRPALNAKEITIEIRVLAPFTKYSDHTAVRNALEAP